MIEAITKCNEFGNVDLIIMHPNLKNAYAKTLETQKRFLDKAALTG
jgi:hypothetical protein